METKTRSILAAAALIAVGAMTPGIANAASASPSSFEKAQIQGTKALDDIRSAYGDLNEKDAAKAEAMIRAALADLEKAPKISDVHLLHYPSRRWWSPGRWIRDRLTPAGDSAAETIGVADAPDMIGEGENYEDKSSYIYAEHWDEISGAAAQLFLPYYHTELYLNNALVHVQNKKFADAKHSLDQVFNSAIIFGVGFDEEIPVTDIVVGTADQ